ncbi:MAG: hypothetical protein HY929_04230 [Euryarchaeota archaeon]|nr:hypothetical protein [Euryarchaeota archaeon]
MERLRMNVNVGLLLIIFSIFGILAFFPIPMRSGFTCPLGYGETYDGLLLLPTLQLIFSALLAIGIYAFLKEKEGPTLRI